MEEIDKKLSKNWAIASYASAGFMAGVNFFDLVNLDTQRAHPAMLATMGISVGLGSAAVGQITYDQFTTSRSVSFADFDGAGARITSVNLIAYSFGWLTIWDDRLTAAPSWRMSKCRVGESARPAAEARTAF